MAPFVLLIALAGHAPAVDLESICRSARANALAEDQARAYDSCIAEETAARAQVVMKWPKASPAMRADCAPMKGLPTSYVAILTCLDIQPGGDFDPNRPK
jgi:hypothetical protein